MTLSNQTKYPSTFHYVLKLRQDIELRAGEIRGRLENMSSGRHFDFGSSRELLDYLVADMSSAVSRSE